MSDEKRETYSEITAELRELSMGAVYCELQPRVFGKTISLYFAELADRIDAAVKRDRVSRRSIKIPVEIVPTCSVAAMRDVLMFLRKKIDEIHTAAVVNGGNRNAIIMACGGLCARIDSALATKPRNCDVFADAPWDTIFRAWQDWLLTPEFNKRKIGGMKDFCYWFLGPAKEGVTK